MSEDIETNAAAAPNVPARLGHRHGADDRPRLRDLQYMSYTGEDGRDVLQVRLMQQVRPHWRALAIAFDFPEYEIAIMEKKDDPVYYLFSEWLRGANQVKDPRPVTWRTLIEALQHADLQEEATVLKKHFIQVSVTRANDAAGIVMQHGPIEVIVSPDVPEGLLSLMEEYAEMLFVLRKTKLSSRKFTELTLFLLDYFQSDEDSICDCSTMSHVITFLQNELKIWIFNIDTLKVIKRKINNSKATSSIEQYRRCLDDFLSSTSVKDFKDALKVQINDPSHDFESIILKLDKSRTEDTLKNLKKLVYDVIGVSSKALIHIRTGIGCVCVTWIVPTSLVSTMRAMAEQRSEKYLANLGVLELVIGLRVAPNEASTSHSDIKEQQSVFTGVNSYHKMFGAMNLEVEDLKRKNEELESKLKAVCREKSEKCEEQEAELKVVCKEKLDYEEKCERQEAELKAVRKEKLDYEEKCERQEAELKVVSKEKLDFEEKCEEQEAELKAVRKEMSDCEGKCEQQEAELKVVCQEKSEYEKTCEEQEAELKAVHKGSQITRKNVSNKKQN